MNTDSLNIHIQSFQLRKIRNSEAQATFKRYESQSLGVGFFTPLFGDTRGGMEGMQTTLRTMVLLYHPIYIMVLRSPLLETGSHVLGLELKLDV